MRRARLLGLAASVILAGLLLRLVPWGLPLRAHHFGGGFLWGAMVYLLVAAVEPSSWRRASGILVACVVALGIELVRLVHTPWLDAFRTTLAGQLLLGRIFSAWNLVAYAAGIAAAAWATQRIGRVAT